MPVTIEYDDSEVIEAIRVLDERTEGLPRDLMEDVGSVIIYSLGKNFMEGGRPEKWIPSQRVQKHGGQTLVKSGRLMTSAMIYEATSSSVDVVIGAGLPYTFIHQYGGYAGRGHASYIPPRPYAMFQQEDISIIENMINEYIDSGEWNPPL